MSSAQDQATGIPTRGSGSRFAADHVGANKVEIEPFEDGTVPLA
ncbi:MAG: hypothetical protein O2824_04750 [Proteobacteria bacterium]|nr:hypothetical protein [Pseudomonadota bacterium]